jgi:hypothetical protein
VIINHASDAIVEVTGLTGSFSLGNFVTELPPIFMYYFTPESPSSKAYSPLPIVSLHGHKKDVLTKL